MSISYVFSISFPIFAFVNYGGVSKVKQSGLKAQYVLSPGQRPG